MTNLAYAVAPQSRTTYAYPISAVTFPEDIELGWKSAEASVLRASVCQDTIAMLSDLYNINERESISAILDSNSDLVPLLLEAPDEIKKRFTDEHLELVLDTFGSTEDDCISALVISLLTSLNVDEALTQQRRLLKDWGFAVMKRSDHRLHICVEPL